LRITVLPFSPLPALNASLNSASTVFLLCSHFFTRHKKIFQHRICMIIAFLRSIARLTSDIYFRLHAGTIRFGGQGGIRRIHFTLLTAHAFLAIVSLPSVLLALSFTLREKFSSHCPIARWTYPIWLYISVTRHRHLQAAVDRLHPTRCRPFVLLLSVIQALFRSFVPMSAPLSPVARACTLLMR
jgi:putative membrane protein